MTLDEVPSTTDAMRRRARRVRVGTMQGLQAARHAERSVYLMTITTPPGMTQERLGRVWTLWRLHCVRYWGMAPEYLRVAERGEDTGMLHYHVLLRCGWWPREFLTWTLAWWAKKAGVKWIRLQKAWAGVGLGNYLAKYLSKLPAARLAGSRFWTAPGWRAVRARWIKIYAAWGQLGLAAGWAGVFYRTQLEMDAVWGDYLAWREGERVACISRRGRSRL